MSEIYKVSINKKDVYGHIAYDVENKKISVEFPDEAVVAEVTSYLEKTHTISEPKAGSTIDFVAREYTACQSKHDLQIVLSRMWSQNQVHVNWSIPVEFQK